MLIASGAEGVRQIECLPTDVPPRGPLRPNWRRERYCNVALLRHLSGVRQHLFPLWVARVDAPDFVLAPCRPDSPMVAVEVTDAGEREHQDWLGEIAACPGVHHIPSPCGSGWNDDAARRHFSTALGEAVKRKLACKFWRNAADLPRWLVLYDNTNAGWFPLAADPEECLRDQVRAGREGGLSALVLVRSLEAVWVVECD